MYKAAFMLENAPNARFGGGRIINFSSIANPLNLEGEASMPRAKQPLNR